MICRNAAHSFYSHHMSTMILRRVAACTARHTLSSVLRAQMCESVPPSESHHGIASPEPSSTTAPLSPNAVVDGGSRVVSKVGLEGTAATPPRTSGRGCIAVIHRRCIAGIHGRVTLRVWSWSGWVRSRRVLCRGVRSGRVRSGRVLSIRSVRRIVGSSGQSVGAASGDRSGGIASERTRVPATDRIPEILVIEMKAVRLRKLFKAHARLCRS